MTDYLFKPNIMFVDQIFLPEEYVGVCPLLYVQQCNFPFKISFYNSESRPEENKYTVAVFKVKPKQ